MARAQIFTSFPAGTISRSGSAEYLGAYEEVRLKAPEYIQEYHPHGGRYSNSLSSSSPTIHTMIPGPSYQQPGTSNYDGRAPSVNQQQSYSEINRPTSFQGGQPLQPHPGILHTTSGHPRTPNQQVRYNLPDGRVYVPTTMPGSIASGSTSGSQKRYDRLADVYSTSGDTVDFARNLGDYVTERCPMGVWVLLTIVLMVIGLLFLMFGALNLPFCTIQPMVPVYLLVAGVLIMFLAGLRIFALLPKGSPNSRRKQLSGDLCLVLCEGIVLLLNVVWLILGCVWVYGVKPYVHFQSGMFEEHYCDAGLYWFAFAGVTFQLILIVIAIVALIILGCVGAVKEADSLDDLE